GATEVAVAQLDAAFMQAQQFAAEGQADAGAFPGAGGLAARELEAVEDAVAPGRVDARATVLDTEAGATGLAQGAYTHPAAARRELEGVADQVRCHARQLLGIAVAGQDRVATVLQDQRDA